MVYAEPDTPLVWRGSSWDSLQTLADDIILSENPVVYAELFEQGLVSIWLEKTGLLATDDNQYQLIREIEIKSAENSLIACFWFAYLFASRDRFECNEGCYERPTELIEGLIESSYEFYKEDGYLSMLLDTEKSYRIWGFICSGGIDRVGCSEYVYRYLEQSASDMSEQVHLLFALFEQIGCILEFSEFVSRVQNAYLLYGPYSDVAYVLRLVKNTDYYYSDNNDGKKILNEIRCLEDVRQGSISEMGTKLIEHKLMTDRILENMQNNPLLSQAGIFDGKSIKCRNLQGYYLYSFLDRIVPMGFINHIESRR